MVFSDELAVIPLVQVRNQPRVDHLLSRHESLIVVVVGGSGAGKSTLAHGALMSSELCDRCEVVRRISTREPRDGDAEDGVRSVPWNEFYRIVERSELILSWERPLSDGSLIGYGCLPPVETKLPIAMGGHGIYTNFASVRPIGTVERCLLVGIYAPSSVRYERILLRSPDVIARGQSYVDRMLAHDDQRMLESVDIVINNLDPTPDRAVAAFASVIEAVLRVR